MFRKEVYNKIELKSDPIGWAFAFELAVKFAKLNSKFGEVPLVAVDRVYEVNQLFGGNTIKWSKEYFKWYRWGIKILKGPNKKYTNT